MVITYSYTNNSELSVSRQWSISTAIVSTWTVKEWADNNTNDSDKCVVSPMCCTENSRRGYLRLANTFIARSDTGLTQ